MDPSLRPRHYEPPDPSMRRTAADVRPELFEERARAVAARRTAPPPRSRSLVPTADGGIGRVLLTVPSYAAFHGPISDAYRALATLLPPETTFVVVTHEAVRTEVASWFPAERRVEVISAPDHLHFSVWAEDGYVAATEAGRTLLVEPFAFPRYGDSLVADLVAAATDVGTTQAPLYFQGGNVLIGDDFVLIGADYPANTLGYVGSVLLPPDPGMPPVEYVHGLYRDYLDPGRELLAVASRVPVPAQQRRPFELDGEQWTEWVHLGNRPGTVQPLFHIDMFITPAGRTEDGRYRLLVGDPRLAAALLGTPLLPQAMADVFDDIAIGLAERGFAVDRNPLPLVHVDDLEQRVRTWYFATANNALVSIGADRDVYLPTYGHGAWPELSRTDEANAALWEGLGFRSHALPDFHPFAANLGAVHCIKKYLSRS